MGNCLIKKDPVSKRLQTDIYYLQKENIRTYDYILGELESIKALVNARSKNDSPSQKYLQTSV